MKVEVTAGLEHRGFRKAFNRLALAGRFKSLERYVASIQLQKKYEFDTIVVCLWEDLPEDELKVIPLAKKHRTKHVTCGFTPAGKYDVAQDLETLRYIAAKIERVLQFVPLSAADRGKILAAFASWKEENAVACNEPPPDILHN